MTTDPETRPWLRASAMPRLSVCPASGAESAGKPDPRGEAATLGTAAHVVLAKLVTDGLKAAEIAAHATASRLGVDADQLIDWARGIEWAPPGGTSLVYAEHPVALDLGETQITGTADVVIFDPEEGLVEVVDWKTGSPDYASASQWRQLEVYGLAAAQEIGAKNVVLSLCYVQLGSDGWSVRTLSDPTDTLSALDEIARKAMLQESLPPGERDYSVGDHCRFCPGRATCPALGADLRAFAALIESPSWEVTAGNAPQLLDRAAHVEKLARAVRDAVKEEVRARGGKMVADDGRTLELVTSERRAYTVEAGMVERLVVRKA